MRPVVRQKWKRYAAQMIRPGLEGRQRISTELQDFAVQLLEFFVVRTEPVDLVRSSPGECKGHERDHDGPPLETGQRDLLFGIMRGQCKVRRGAACLDFHTCLLLAVWILQLSGLPVQHTYPPRRLQSAAAAFGADHVQTAGDHHCGARPQPEAGDFAPDHKTQQRSPQQGRITDGCHD